LTATADSVAASLVGWIGSVAPDVSVKMQPLGARTREAGIDLRLFRANPRAPAREPLPPLVLDLDFVLTIQLADAVAEQRTLAELLLAAMQREDLEVLTDRCALELCVMLGLPPAPGFVLRTPFIRTRIPPPTPRVRSAVIRTSDLGFVAGRVLGPGDVPIPGASVMTVGSGNAVRTDGSGTFRLPVAPRLNVQLVAHAHGSEATGAGSAGEFVTLRLPLEI
jgi:hypothetical protein